MKFKFVLVVCLLVCVSICPSYAESSFDLAGPKIEVSVSRAGKSIPISQVPALESGDKIWVHPAFPSSESVHYVLVVAFLRGATNPPSDQWFTKAETWTKNVRKEGILVTVPDQAQQALLFLAPQTGGDFTTLRSAVQGKPGAFVRAGRDLYLASSDRLRLDKYLSAIREGASKDPKVLHERSLTLARTLNLKLDSQCFDKPTEEQGPCLTQNTDQMVLDDGHGQSMLATLSTGPEVDLIGAVSATREGGGGVFSPYIGVLVDLAHVMESLHTAQYQYIPALGLPHDGELNLKLNNPPSFHKPMSVLVVALPPVKQASAPVLRPLDPKQVLCVQKPSLVFPIESEPLVFATSQGHDYSMHLQSKTGKSVDVPVHPDASSGGFVPDKPISIPDDLGSNISASLHGKWGFQSFDGPVFELRSTSGPAEWKPTQETEASLIVGREDTFHVHSDVAACVEEISMKDEHGKAVKSSWKLNAPDDLEIKATLPEATPGNVQLAVKQFGLHKPAQVSLKTYAESGRIDHFSLHAGDQVGVLKGRRLDQIQSLEVAGVHFLPVKLTRVQKEKEDELSVEGSNEVKAKLQPNEEVMAHVALKDGRVLEVKSTVEPPRPSVTLIGKKIKTSSSAVRLSSKNDLPTDGTLTFFVKSQVPAAFPRSEKIEVASEDGSFNTMLSIDGGSLSLQDSQTAIATLNPTKSFGSSAFGPLRFRPVAEDGTAGDWQPLVRLVRVPILKEVHCPEQVDSPCALHGQELFLIDSVSAEPDFSKPVSVPTGFAEETLAVPRPRGTLLYLKLRDDPDSINTTALPVLPDEK